MSPKEALDKFISSWREHDIKELTDLFEDKFEYIINGKVRFDEKTHLRRYWSTNAFRQIDLNIFTQSEVQNHDSITCLFTALFYNPGRLAVTAVSGTMTISIGPAGRIASLTEEYAKAERRSALYSLDAAYTFFVSPLVRTLHPTAKAAKNILKTTARFGLLLLFALGAAGLVYINFVHDPKKPWISNNIVDAVRPYTAYYFAILFIIHQILPFLQAKVAKDIEVRKFTPPGDLKIMAKELKGADRVSILSGDFSFLSDNPILEETLRTLAFQGKLELFSYKSQEEVEREAKIKSKTYEIFLKLMDDGNFYFNCKMRVKCTVAEFSSVKKLLFRFSGDGASSDERHMGVVRPRQNSAYLIEIVDQMFSSLRATRK